MQLLRLLLFPFSVLYGWVMALRNFLYNQGLLKSHTFSVPIIGVGNLTMGGTGKTPHVEYLLRLLAPFQRATLSRGYGRRTKGYLLADHQASSATIGDEPFQYYADFPEVKVAVCEDRVKGIRQLLELRPRPEVIVLDDVFQHRAVRPQLQLLITDYGRLFSRDYVLPYGLLREHRSGARRADAVVVSKCDPEMREREMDQLAAEVRRYCRGETPVFFSTYRYGAPVPFGSESVFSVNLILVTGIANPKPLKEHLQKEGFTIVEHLKYPDHYAFREADLKKMQDLVEQYRGGKGISLVTTRKDAVRLQEPGLRGLSKKLPYFFVPVTVAFLRHQEQFDNMVMRRVQALAQPQKR